MHCNLFTVVSLADMAIFSAGAKSSVAQRYALRGVGAGTGRRMFARRP